MGKPKSIGQAELPPSGASIAAEWTHRDRAYYRMTDGRIFFVDYRGWVFDQAEQSVPHPLVDHVMQAILAHEARAS